MKAPLTHYNSDSVCQLHEVRVQVSQRRNIHVGINIPYSTSWVWWCMKKRQTT